MSLPVRGAWIEIPPIRGRSTSLMSLPVRGAWIEILLFFRRVPTNATSLPVRGAWIEMADTPTPAPERASLPVRGAWIEIPSESTPQSRKASRSPCGERGLKFAAAVHAIGGRGRSPCGERGLKYTHDDGTIVVEKVAPRAGSVD